MWEDYFKHGSNYTERIKDIIPNIGLISNISYQQTAELINLFTGCEISRETTFKFHDAEINEFLTKEEKKVQNAIKKSKYRIQ